LAHKNTATYNPAPNTTWADRMKVSNSTTRAKIGTILDISNNVIDESVSKLNRYLVGFFPGYKMLYHAVNSIAFQVWKNYGLESVMTTQQGFLMFYFKSEDDVNSVIEKGP
jgi:hypothetical protein